ncbi:hypothetical protein ACRWQN_12650 [Shewanella sp. HL-SH8]|uniref:hypothetical protein n=1 Tax=Shewanella sp. HL-SH8 TaxID=3436242 RepID=UPI003EBE15C4
MEGHDGIHTERAANKLFKTMYDVELVLRFFAYRQKHDLHTKSLESYFDRFLEQGNYLNQEVLDNLASFFNRTIDLAFDLFEEQAFQLYREHKGKWAWFDRATVAVYDPMMLVLSQHLDKREILLSQKELINSEIEEFYKENYAAFGGRNVNELALKTREDLLEIFIQRFF